MLKSYKNMPNFYILITTTYQKEKKRNNLIYNCHKKNKIFRNKFHEGGHGPLQ